MTVELLEGAVAILGDVGSDLVFVGGATVDVYVTEPGGTTTRPTIDVDVVAAATTRVQYEDLAERLRDCGLREDIGSEVICRWRHGRDLILDVMPVSADVFGFTNPWYAVALATAADHPLPSGRTIRICHPSVFVATKLAAFDSRGAADALTSRDLEDIVRVFDGRSAIVSEIENGNLEVRAYLQARIADLLSSRMFEDSVRAFLLPDPGSQARADTVVLPRMRQVAGLAP